PKPSEVPEPSGTPKPSTTSQPTPDVSGTPTKMPEVTPDPIGSPDVKPNPTEKPSAKPSAKPQETGKPSSQPTEIPQKPSGGSNGQGAGTENQIPNSGEEKINGRKSQSETVKKVKKKKSIKTLKLIKCKKGTKKIVGKTVKKAKIIVKVGKRSYRTTATSKGRFQIKLKKKLKSGTKIQVTVAKSGYYKRKKSFRIK
ncbi:MAG: hypothetical protein K2K70_03570, partial [Lachnospiraceae bacterium]|nr:hypothetical protein [Lachnospiraceae bacterium]